MKNSYNKFISMIDLCVDFINEKKADSFKENDLLQTKTFVSYAEKLKEYKCQLSDAAEKIIEIADSCGFYQSQFYTQRNIISKERYYTRNIYSLEDNRYVILLNNLHTFVNYSLICCSKKHREFFPEYNKEFILETDIGEINTRVTSASSNEEKTNPMAGIYIKGNLKQWYDKHPELKIGDKIIIEKIEHGQRYKLDIERD